MGRVAGRYALKLTSLLFACFIWFYVFNGKSITISVKAPLVLIPPPGKAVANIVPRDVQFTFEGARAFIKNIPPPEKLKIYVQLPRGKNSVDILIKKEPPHLPFGVKTVGISPESINISLEREIKKWVPLKAELVGSAPSRHSKIVLRPDKILIRGPYSIMKKTGLLKTIPIEIEDIQENPKQILPLNEVDPRITLEDFDGEVKLHYTEQ